MTTPLDEAIRAGCDAHVWAIDGHTQQPIKCRYPACGRFCSSSKMAVAAIRAFIENPYLGISSESLQTLQAHLDPA